MLLRNRTGEHLKLDDLAAGQADLAAAATLEPDAPRIAILAADLAAALGDSAGLLAQAQVLIARSPADASGYFYQALGHLFAGDAAAARAAMAAAASHASTAQRSDGLDTLAQTARRHPDQADALAALAAILQGDTP
jgi:hypothetical protein